MPTTPNLGIPYPASTDAPDGPGAIYNLATKIDNANQTGTIGYSGTVHDFGSGFYTALRRANNIVSFVLNVDPGASGLSASQTANLIANVGPGFRPMVVVTCRCPIYNGAWNGAFADINVQTNGDVRITYCSIGTITAGGLITGSFSWPVTLP